MEAAPLHEAAKKGDLQQCQELILKGHDVNEREDSRWSGHFTPLHYAAARGHLDVVYFTPK